MYTVFIVLDIAAAFLFCRNCFELLVINNRCMEFGHHKGFSGGTLDMQMIDIGIAMSHFDLAAKEAGLELHFALNAPDIPAKDGEEYVASFEF